MASTSKYREEIVELNKQGISRKEISEKLGCSISTVQYNLSTSTRKRAVINRLCNSEHRKNLRKKGVLRNRLYVDEILKNSSCIDCGNSDVRVLEFDHVRGEKILSISHCIRNAWRLDRLKEEIAKCEIRCCNCHRIVTIERRQS